MSHLFDAQENRSHALPLLATAELFCTHRKVRNHGKKKKKYIQEHYSTLCHVMPLPRTTGIDQVAAW